MRKWILIFLFLFPLFMVKGQDIHFSQSMNLPLWQTPAAAGMMNADYRFSAIYKNQWSSVPVPFNTLLISGDANILKFKNGDRLNAGLLLYSDRAGDSKMSIYQADLAISYAKSLGDSMHYLSAGFMVGTAGRSFSSLALTFDNQYIDGAYNPSVPIDEIFGRTSFNTIDISAGLMYSRMIGSKVKLDVGFGLFHLNSPRISFYQDVGVDLNMRYHIFASTDIRIGKDLRMKPLVFYQKQDVKYELMIADIFTYRIHSLSIPYLAVQFGAMYRNQDALVAYGGLKYNSLLVGISYDINTSQLSNASRSNGGIEISAVYQMSRVGKINSKGAVCPIF